MSVGRVACKMAGVGVFIMVAMMVNWYWTVSRLAAFRSEANTYLTTAAPRVSRVALALAKPVLSELEQGKFEGRLEVLRRPSAVIIGVESDDHARVWSDLSQLLATRDQQLDPTQSLDRGGLIRQQINELRDLAHNIVALATGIDHEPAPIEQQRAALTRLKEKLECALGEHERQR